MKNFVSSMAVKIICVILMPVISYFSVFSIIFVSVHANNNISQQETSSEYYVNSDLTGEENYNKYYFTKSETCKRLLNEDAYYLCSLFAENDYVDAGILDQYSIENSNLKVVVYSVKDGTYTPLFYNNRLINEELLLSAKAELFSVSDPETMIVAELTLDRNLEKNDKYRIAYESYYYMKDNYNIYFIAAFVLVFLFTAILIILCAGAGRKKNSNVIILNFYNRIPIEIVLGIYGALLLLSGRWLSKMFMMPYRLGESIALLQNIALFSIPFFLIINIIIVPFIVSLAARIGASTNKVLPFWKNFLILRIIYFLFRKIKDAGKFIIKNTSAVFVGTLGFLIYWAINSMLILLGKSTHNMTVILCVIFNILVLILICLFLSNLDRLGHELQKLEKGEFDDSVDSSSYMLLFRKYAKSLKHTKEGMALAVEKNIKNERFKTELITNVSHDLKTPLTSIINYVDLLRKEDADSEKAKEYLNIVDNRSQRLKKLVEDLIEVSKASTGNIKVNLTAVDIEEFINQANGEFVDRFENAGLSPVVNPVNEKLFIIADGTLLWRVFSNLLSNICKYSLKDTRIYFDVVSTAERVEIIIKNISSSPLNITAQELTERFVRGDKSRNTEGSGLGLSIAKSLTEAQNGTFNIDIDGDLFKVILSFSKYIPKADMPEMKDGENGFLKAEVI